MNHPGHGQTEPSTWRHYLTEPDHLIALAAIVTLVIAWLLYRRLRPAMSDDER